MLLNNYSVLNRNVGASLGNAFTNPHALFKATLMANWYVGGHVVVGETAKSAFNNGYNVQPDGGYSWWLPLTEGGIAANRFSASGSLTGAIAGGRNGIAALSGSGDITSAQASLIVSAIAALVGSGEVSSASLNAVLQAIAELSGSGATTATIKALGSAIAALSGSGSVAVTAAAKGQMNCAIVVTGDALSTANVADAVWKALAEGNFTYAQCLQLVAAAVAAKTSDSGLTFRDLSDTKDRISGTVTGSDRTAVVYELD